MHTSKKMNFWRQSVTIPHSKLGNGCTMQPSKTANLLRIIFLSSNVNVSNDKEFNHKFVTPKKLEIWYKCTIGVARACGAQPPPPIVPEQNIWKKYGHFWTDHLLLIVFLNKRHKKMSFVRPVTRSLTVLLQQLPVVLISSCDMMCLYGL